MTQMTVIDERDLMWLSVAVREPVHPAGVRVLRPRGRRPGPARPRVAPLSHRGTGVAMSRVSHQTKKVSTRATLALAGLAALITVWLGSLADLNANAPVSTQVPEQLAVVRVQAGETLQELAERVAPETPVAQVVRRITDLNQLGSSAVEAGQTLIAPIS